MSEGKRGLRDGWNRHAALPKPKPAAAREKKPSISQAQANWRMDFDRRRKPGRAPEQ